MTETPRKSSLRRILLKYFIQGLLYIAPVAITIYALVISFEFLDQLVAANIEKIIGIRIPGLGILTIVIFVTLIGFFGSTFVFNPIMRYFDRAISKAPLIKIIYSSVRDLLLAFVGNQKKFTEPVVVSFGPMMEMERLGFLTQKDLSHLGIEDNKVSVYFPSSYSVMGEVVIVPRENVRPLNVPPADVMKFIVSGGVTRVGHLEVEGGGDINSEKTT